MTVSLLTPLYGKIGKEKYADVRLRYGYGPWNTHKSKEVGFVFASPHYLHGQEREKYLNQYGVSIGRILSNEGFKVKKIIGLRRR